MAYFIVLLMGVGSLFPWNAFITAGDYFTTVYASNQSFMSFLTLWNTYPNFFFMLLSVKWGGLFSIRGFVRSLEKIDCFRIALFHRTYFLSNDTNFARIFADEAAQIRPTFLFPRSFSGFSSVRPSNSNFCLDVLSAPS